MEDDMWREVSNPYAAIGWIREELNNLLRQVRIGLEAAAEENDLSLLENAENALEKLHLTLEMLRSPGASLLADEMRGLLSALRNDQIEDTESALVALMQALVIEDTYLDRLQAGGSDMPLLLLPALNDLRAASNQALLSESMLFTPDLSAVGPQEIPNSEKQAPDHSAATNKWQEQFSRALANYKKNPKDKAITEELVQRSAEIQAGIKSYQQKRLWWIATAVFSGLQSKVVEDNISLQSLFQRLTHSLDELKQGNSNNEQIAALTTSLLYYLALANSGNPQVDKIRESYQLEQLVMPADELDRMRSGVSGHNRKLFESLSAAIGDEFEIIKTRMTELEEGITADDEGQISLDALTTRLADTLSVLGLQQSTDTLRQASKILAKAREAGKPPTDKDLIQIAGDIISIENSLDRHVSTLGSARESQAASTATPQLPAHELWQMIGKLLGECLTLLGSIKDQVTDWLSGELSADNYASINQDFEQLVGALNLANHQPATKATRRLKDITAGMLEHKEVPPEEIQELFADAFAALEMFLAAARDQQPQSGNLLELMLQRLDLLESGPDATTTVIDLPKLEPTRKPAPVAKPLVDDDILEIFMEEYDEVYASLESVLPQWLTDTDNTEARSELRRGFHTLKGSGRMVGADEIAEFSWKVEMLLNQVVEGEREADNNTLKAIAVASAMLPALKDRLQGDSSTIEPSLLPEFSTLLDQLASDHAGTGDKLNTFIEYLPEELKTWLNEELLAVAEPFIDPELAHLIREEVVEHLATLKKWLAGASQTIPGDEPIRAAHTIAGTMALVPGGNEEKLESKLAHELENLLNRCQSGEIEFKKTATKTVTKVIEQISNRLKTLEQAVAPDDIKNHPLIQSLAQHNKDIRNEILARTEAVKAASERAAAEKAAAEKAAAEKAAAEKAATEKAATERAATEKAATEKAATERAAT
ncbi:MAG: Hpt domain-containing protein, partial [Xanthomonadales bacterium]|nr:Hpt domain-containing protein [Xanthomonadales bacterium]